MALYQETKFPAKHKRDFNDYAKACEVSAETLKVGIVGCGYWGPKLARNFHQLPGAKLAVACDMREDRLQSIGELYPNTSLVKDYQEVLASDVDAVVIATTVRTHYPLAKSALRAGKHVLVEKPIAASSFDAAELVQIADERDLILMVGHTFEYNPAVEAVRDIVNSRELGQIYYLNSTRVNLGLLQPDINVMWDLGPHDISMIRFILDQDPAKVSARGGNYVNKHSLLHEVVYMVLTFPDGTMANLRLSWLDPVKQRKLTIVGSKKMLVYDDIAQDKVVIFDKGVEIPEYSVTEEEFHASYRHGEEVVHPLNWDEPLRAECAHFLEAIRSGSTPRSSGKVGLKVVKVLETAQRSLRNGGVELQIEY